MHASLVVLVVAAAASQPQSWKFKTGPKAEVSVSNIAGSISVEGTKGDEVTVDAVVTGGDPAKWLVEVTGEGEKVRARVCCGDCETKNRHCEVRDGEVEFKVRVPEKSSLRLHGVSATINVSGAAGPQDIHSVSGAIQISRSEAPLHIRSVSGNVQVAPAAVSEMDVHTVSGDVQINFPTNPDATVELKTVSGKLNGRRVGLGSSQESFGKGTAQVKVHTVSGSVKTEPMSI